MRACSAPLSCARPAEPRSELSGGSCFPAHSHRRSARPQSMRDALEKIAMSWRVTTDAMDCQEGKDAEDMEEEVKLKVRAERRASLSARGRRGGRVSVHSIQSMFGRTAAIALHADRSLKGAAAPVPEEQPLFGVVVDAAVAVSKGATVPPPAE